MTTHKSIPDADLSGAGDDFHVLWTIKKSLELLNFDNSGLKVLVIEGIEESLSKKIDSFGENFLGIDLTEYFGGKTFDEADFIVISQLKYSTRRVSENFTFSEFYEGKKSRSHKGSIIHRFATIFKTFLNEFGRDKVLEKVKIKLVSNRNINSSHLDQINQVQQYLRRNKRVLSFNSVLDKCPLISKSAFDKLRNASELNLQDFTDFVRLLDFEDCGAASRQRLKFELIHSISKASVKSSHQFNSLFQMIWNKMMPEKRDERTVTFLDVIANFGFSSIEYLFPVTENFENNFNSVKRQQLDSIISIIENNISFLPICIHGGAGIGKSTIVNQIKNALPAYSECILFDCYGAGKYQNPEDKRHLHRKAIVHIANELARRVGTEFLLLQNESDDIYLHELKKRIQEGIDILRDRNSLASIVFIIDAADNSITAARNNGEKSFVEDLVNIEVPNGCHIIVTSRTYRKETLHLPDKFIDIELEPFSLQETTLFVKKSFPNISNEKIKEFHQYTKGIPRVQYYSISLKNQGINEIINYLKPNGKNVDELILDKIESALNRIGKDKKTLVERFFKLLISLPRPVPIRYLSEIMKVDISFLKDLSSDIWNGLILEEELFSFRDEDFENHIRGIYQITSEELDEIAQIFLDKSQTDEYASINLGILLFKTNYKNELINIVLNKNLLTLPKDPIKNKEVYINRTKLALKVSKENQDDLTYFKILFIAAEESKTDKLLTELLTEYPDLVASFGDDTSLSRFKFDSGEKSWAGGFHLKLAGLYSRKLETQEIALKHLRTASEWLNWRKQKNEEELREFPITSLDVAYEVEAFLRIFGVKRALEALNRWKPKGIRLSAGNYLIENIISFSRKEDILKWLNFTSFRVDVKLFVICKLFQYNQTIDIDLKLIASHFEIILRKNKIKFKENFLQIIVQFVGVLVHNKVDSNILQFVVTKPLVSVPYFSKEYPDNRKKLEMDITLTKETLMISLENRKKRIEDFYPEHFKEISKIVDYDKRSALESEIEKFRTFYKHAISIYQLRSDILVGLISQSDGLMEFEKICSTLKNDYNFKNQFGYWANDRFVFLSGKLTEIALLLDDQNKSIEFIINSMDCQIDKLKLRFNILDKIYLREGLSKTSLKLLNELDEIINDSELSSKEIVDNYIKCLILSSKIDDSFSRHFFNRTITATSEIDYEALAQIRSLYHLSKIGIVNPNPKLAYEYARFIEYCDIKLGYYDKKHFPYSEGLLGIGNIDESSMFATLCRWHHRNIIEIGSEINTLIKSALEKGYINHIVAGSLLNLKISYSYEELEYLYKLIIQKFDESGDSGLKSRFVQLEFRDLRLNNDNYFSRKLYNEVQNGRFIDNNLISEMKSYIDFLDVIERKKHTEEINEFKKEDFLHNIDLINLDVTSIKEIEEAINSIIINNPTSHSNRWNIEKLLLDILDRCSPNEYTRFLDAIVGINDNLLSFYSFENIIEKAINEWGFYPKIKEWKQENFKYILLIKFKHFDSGNTLNIWSIRDFASLFEINELQLADIMIDILSQKVDLLSDESIYSSFELIKSKLNIHQNEELLGWILERWTSKIKPDIADGYWIEELIPPMNANENIAYLLRFILGHPDKRLRWSAIHSIRRLVSLNNIEILTVLLDKQNDKFCFPFQNKEFIYYWMSSKLYLWIAIDRVSVEYPEKIVSLKDLFYKELMSTDLPHVLIREYIKNTCLNILKWDSSIYSEDEIENIHAVNITKLGYEIKKISKNQKRKYSTNSQKEWSFNFCALDTLPYWYRPIGESFNLSEYDVADIADKFITEKWEYVGETHKDDFIRNQLYDRDWYLTRNDKGSNPKIEDLSVYFEYHAMYCAAGFLLERETLLETDSWNRWEYWLKSETNAFKEFWLSDLRDPTPLNIEYYLNTYEGDFDLRWRDNIEDECFDESVGFCEQKENNFFIAYGGISKQIGVNSERISIRSCLVSNKGADALLRALQTAKSSYDYSIPIEEDENDDCNSDSEESFFMSGWLMDVMSDANGLDYDDPFLNGAHKGYIKFGSRVHSQFDIQYNELFKCSYTDNKMISLYENWNDLLQEESRRYSSGIQTSGCIFKVNKDFLLNFLKVEQKSLILKCMINRDLDEQDWDERNYDNTHCVKLYLIKEDGTIKTLRGKDYKIGRKNN